MNHNSLLQNERSVKFDLGIVVPTYNEKENIHELLDLINIQATSNNLKLTLLIVDDNSPDGTGDIVEEIINSQAYPQLNLQLLRRAGKQGLASAYKQGFTKIGDNCEFVMSMDADMSHNPKYIAQMLNLAKKGYACVIGSRYINGGGVLGWGPYRTLISRLGSLYAQIFLFSPIKDQTGGFNLYKYENLKQLNISEIKAEGYMFQIEMKYIFRKNKFKIKEFPIIFVDRVHGKSKISRKIILEAFIRVPLLKLGL